MKNDRGYYLQNLQQLHKKHGYRVQKENHEIEDYDFIKTIGVNVCI